MQINDITSKKLGFSWDGVGIFGIAMEIKHIRLMERRFSQEHLYALDMQLYA